jgi:hypothetical protein
MTFGDDFRERTGTTLDDSLWDAGNGGSVSGASMFSLAGTTPNYLQMLNSGTSVTGRIMSSLGTLSGPQVVQVRATPLGASADGVMVAGLAPSLASVTSGAFGIMSAQTVDHTNYGGTWNVLSYDSTQTSRFTAISDGTNASFQRDTLVSGAWQQAWTRPNGPNPGPFPFNNAAVNTFAFSNVTVSPSCAESTAATCMNSASFTGGAVSLACGSSTTVSTDMFTGTSLTTSICGATLTGHVRSQVGGGPQVVVFPINGNLTLSGTLRLIGGKPVIFQVMGNVTLSTGAVIDVSSIGQLGAGANVSCVGMAAAGTHSTGSNAGSGGGAGGGFGTSGANGGSGNSGGAGGASMAPQGSSNLTPLRGGCKGGSGGSAGNNAFGGDSGGAIQISATGTVVPGVGAQLKAAGGGGQVGTAQEDGGGGGLLRSLTPLV